MEFHTEVFHMYGNWLFNTWTEWSVQTIPAAKRKQQHKYWPKNFCRNENLLLPLSLTLPVTIPQKAFHSVNPCNKCSVAMFYLDVLAKNPLCWRHEKNLPLRNICSTTKSPPKKPQQQQQENKNKQIKNKQKNPTKDWSKCVPLALPFPLLALISSVTPSTGSQVCKLTLHKLISESIKELSEKLPLFYISASLDAFICQWWNKQSLIAWPPALTLSPKH